MPKRGGMLKDLTLGHFYFNNLNRREKSTLIIEF